MPPSVHERLRELETEVRDLQVRPAAAVRARGHSRVRRQRAALIAVAAVVAVGVPFAWPHHSTAPITSAERPDVTCVLSLPDSPAAVKLRLFQGGESAGRLDATVSQLQARGFVVQKGDGNSGDATALRYGPATIGAAAFVQAELRGEIAMRFDPARRDDTIDLILGPSFTRLATPTEINQSLVTLGEPTAPPECR